MTKLLLLCAALASLSCPVFAHEDGDGAACKEEMRKLCPGMKPGDGRFGPCVKEHHDELSPDCQARLKERMEDGDEKPAGKDAGKKIASPPPIPPDCLEAAGKLCPGLKPGDGKFGPCMTEHKEDVPDACKAAMRRMWSKGEKGDKKPKRGRGGRGMGGGRGDGSGPGDGSGGGRGGDNGD